jgi:basic amino acid/polyamine antiporter, APA family
VVILRFRQPSLVRPYRVHGYPVLPLAFSAAALAILGNTLISKPIQSFLGLGVVLTGIPVYFLWTRHSVKPL